MGKYCNSTDVAEIIGIGSWPPNGPVTAGVVEKWIARTEDRVDQSLGRSYKKTTITEEMHSFDAVNTRRNVGIPVYLNYDHLFDFDSASGDKVEIWDGNTWVQLHSTGTEGRGNDFWFDLVKGVLYLNIRQTMVLGVRVTYRTGNYTTIPGYISDATALLVAARVVTLDGTAAILSSEGREVDPSEKVRLWTKEAQSILDSQRGFRSISTLAGGFR